MTGVTLNFDASNVVVEDRADAIPAGWYNVTVTNTERKPSKQKPQNSYLEVTYTVMDGPHAGRKLFNRINLWNDDPTAVDIAFKGAAGIAALQQSVGVFNCQSTAQLHGIPLKLKVKLRAAGPGGDGKHYEASNDVVKHAAITADVGGDDSGGVPGAPGGAAPAWAAGAPAAAAAPAAAFPPAPAQAPPVAAAPPAAAAQPWDTPGAPAHIAAAVAAAPPAPAPAPPVVHAPAPPVMPAGPTMLPAANGIPYEEYRKQGWTDELLVAHGMMVAPAAPAVPSAAPTPAAAAGPANAAAPWAT